MTRVRLAVLLVALGSVFAAFLYVRRTVDRPASNAPTAREANAYADPAACATCHGEIARTYALTGMGRSFAKLRPGDAAFASGPTFQHEPSDRVYTMLERDGRLFQRRHQIGVDGRETNVVEIEAHYVAGSGNHARTFIHRKADGTLIQLPLTWYAANGGFWAMSPGYDRPAHLDTRRPIATDCFSCHNGYPRAPVSDAATVPKFEEPLPEGIDCQRCHGPGREHIAAVNSRDLDAARRAIVNPRALDRTRQLETCMQCHLETTSSPLPFQIRRYERAPFTYMPGRPLGDYFVHFDHAPGTGRDDKFEIASGAYRLRKSACFQQSEMTCVTCHNPHEIPRGAAATQHYIGVCQSCHTTAHPTGPPDVAGAGPRATCLDCHMPKRRAEDAVHVLMTDHLIQRRRPAGDLLAARRESDNFDQGTYRGEVVLYYPPELPATADSELYLALAQVQHGSNLAAGIPRLEAALEAHAPARPEFYFELARAYAKRPDHDAAIRWSEAALRRDARFVPALKELAAAAMASGRLSHAADALEKAIAIRAKDAEALADLGNVYLQQRRIDDARRMLERSLALDPDLPRANNTMALALLEAGNAQGAEEFVRTAIRLQPDLAEARNNLGNMLARRRAYAEAAYEFAQAVRSDPNYAEAQHSYGIVLALTQSYAKAVVALQAAVKLRPGLSQAHLDLGDVLVTMGRRDEARQHFEAAAKSGDAEIREAALASLRGLGR